MMACYCRVSTRRQKVDSQKADILCWLTSHAVTPAAVQWFEDVDSGTTLKRPAFDRLQQGIFTGTITTVVVWKLDRISRRQREGGEHQQAGGHAARGSSARGRSGYPRWTTVPRSCFSVVSRVGQRSCAPRVVPCLGCF